MADLHVDNHGSIFLLSPGTEAGREWIKGNIEYERWAMWAGGVAVDHHCIADIVEGAINDGLEVE